MLKFRKLDHRPWPVTVAFVTCDEGTGEMAELEQTFVAHFTPFAETDLLRIRSEIFGDEANEANQKRLADMTVAEYEQLEATFITNLVIGWSKVADEEGASVPYSPATLRAMCTGADGAAFRRGFNRAISQIRFGVAPAKNAATSPPPGPMPASVEAASTS